MTTPLDYMWTLRSKAESYNRELVKNLNLSEQDFPVNAYGMVFNALTLCTELMYYYYNICWNEPLILFDVNVVERKRKQNAERIIELEKMIFVSVISSLEYCMNEYCKNAFDKKCWNFSALIEKSKETNLISDIEFDHWKGALGLRNSIVHNNGIINDEYFSNKVYEYPGGSKLVFKKDIMTKGNLLLFLHIIDSLLDAHKSWCINIHEEDKRNYFETLLPKHKAEPIK